MFQELINAFEGSVNTLLDHNRPVWAYVHSRIPYWHDGIIVITNLVVISNKIVGD